MWGFAVEVIRRREQKNERAKVSYIINGKLGENSILKS